MDSEEEEEEDEEEEEEYEEEEDEEEDEEEEEEDAEEEYEEEEEEEEEPEKVLIPEEKPTLVDRLCSCCIRRKITPGDATVDVSDDENEWKEPPPADMRITLKIISSENIKVRDWISGSAPYLLIKPDGNKCLRRTFASSSQWLTPNYKFEETFEFDISASELPIRVVIWDHLEQISSPKEMKYATKEYAKKKLNGDPKEAFMRYVEVPDMDDQKKDAKRRRALPEFLEIPESRTPKRAWFPVQDSPLFRTGEDAFIDATNSASKGRVPVAGITMECSFLKIDPLTGELIDAIEEVVDETEVDKRALLRFLDSTSEPPKAVWKPVCNWRQPDASRLSRWSGVKTELRPRILTHNEKTGELLEPTEVYRAVSLDASNVKATGFVPLDWFEPFPQIGTALAALHTINISQNALEGGELPMFADLPELTALDISENSLRGEVSLLSLPPSIKVLNLDYNHFRGPITPLWFSSLPNLTHLRLSGNRLGCEIPCKCWHYLPCLEELHMSKCLLDGGLPASIADALELKTIDLSSNELDGDLPSSLMELQWLEEVSFSGCSRLSDSRGIVSQLRKKGAVVHIWGTGIPDPT